jgi:hypothetical protein
MTDHCCYRFKMSIRNIQYLIDHSSPSLRQDHIYNVIKCDFMWYFEQWCGLFEKFHSKLQKSSYVININPKRKTTPFMRINAFCKKCPFESRVKYLILIKRKPITTEEYVKVKIIVIGNHNHFNINDNPIKKSNCKHLKLYNKN